MQDALIISAVAFARYPWRAWRQKVAQSLARFGRAVAAAWRRRSAIRRLEALDHRMLADIGLRRGEIEFAVRGGRYHFANMSVPRGTVLALAAVHSPPFGEDAIAASDHGQATMAKSGGIEAAARGGRSLRAHRHSRTHAWNCAHRR
jgi:uncharacterized protein YjiS (DUF1127 family)